MNDEREFLIWSRQPGRRATTRARVDKAEVRTYVERRREAARAEIRRWVARHR